MANKISKFLNDLKRNAFWRGEENLAATAERLHWKIVVYMDRIISQPDESTEEPKDTKEK